MSKIDPPKTRALWATLRGGWLPPGGKDPEVLEHRAAAQVFRPDLVGHRGFKHQGARHGIYAGPHGDARVVDLRRNGAQRVAGGEVDLCAVDPDGLISLHAVLAPVHRRIDLLLLRPESDVARQVDPHLGPLGDLRGVPPDVPHVVDGDHLVTVSPRHAPHGQPEWRRPRRGPREEIVAVLVLGIGDGEKLPQELIHLLAEIPHLRLVQRAVRPLHAQLTNALQDVHGAAQVSLRRGDGAADALHVLPVALVAQDLRLEARRARGGHRVVTQLADARLPADLPVHLVHVILAQARIVVAVVCGQL